MALHVSLVSVSHNDEWCQLQEDTKGAPEIAELAQRAFFRLQQPGFIDCESHEIVEPLRGESHL